MGWILRRGCLDQGPPRCRPQEDTLDTELTLEENLYIYGRYFDLPGKVIRERIDELLSFVQLSERRTDKVEPLSGG